MADQMSGGCACGRVRYSATVYDDEAYLCHCRMCQRATGSISIAFKNVKQAEVKWDGEPDWYDSSPIANRPYCRECGTSLGFAFKEGSEDMDLTVRLQKHFRRRREPFRIVFVPSPLCFTQAPEDWISLRSQRLRWRRGLLQVLWRHRGMIGNPRFGLVGVIMLPYTVVFEGFAPLLELSSYAVTTAVFLTGGLDLRHYVLIVLIWTFFGTAVSMIAVLLNDVATGKYMRGADLPRLIAVALIENYGYRQLNAWWGCVGTVQAITGTGGWGTMKRRAFAGAGVPQA